MLRAALAGKWGYVIAVAGSIVTFLLLFQPWIIASGPAGKVRANAFGRIDATTNYLTAWSQLKSPTADVTGMWALFTSAALVISVAAVVIHLRLRSDLMDRLATIATVAAAVFVLATLVYLNSKGSDLKAMTTRRWDLGGQVGSLMAWAFGNGQLILPGMREVGYSSASLTPAAMFASITSIGSALACISQRILGRKPNKYRSPDVDSGKS
ncbi:hypothetical protein FOH10_04265 [Nocardia otitidiscaviarum]|uniref:Uncharacterized protein n=1 Tax=Nocardia otitidiscaviarum TaxID=1823 RepID=A0A516NGN6_9NOCA|nr:hypothetical protein [Nocardia otitidiscaviarum]MCP9625432.1 hypothetical protein [Nocardia otitidiscaviarum]QDP78066.1 hypothetical protein FOH10_04265 [Nocardia otitidiscaviarum]